MTMPSQSALRFPGDTLMIQVPATRPAPAFEAVYALVRENLDPRAGDIPVDRLMQVFRRLSDLYDTDVSSPLNMGYFCIDADAASVAAMDETNRRGANVAVRASIRPPPLSSNTAWTCFWRPSASILRAGPGTSPHAAPRRTTPP